MFLIDENFSELALPVLDASGHTARLARGLVSSGAVDEAVAAAADSIGAIVLTQDRDFVRVVARRPAENVRRWRRLGRVLVTCRARKIPERLAESLPLIEWEYAHLSTRTDARVIIEVGGDVIRVER